MHLLFNSKEVIWKEEATNWKSLVRWLLAQSKIDLKCQTIVKPCSNDILSIGLWLQINTTENGLQLTLFYSLRNFTQRYGPVAMAYIGDKKKRSNVKHTRLRGIA